MFIKEAAALKKRVSKVPAVCITTDCWTSRTTTSFMSITCHFIEDFCLSSCLLDCFEFSERHTADNLADKLKGVAAEWGLEKKVVCCLTDNAANITKAIQLTGWAHLPCLAHTISLVVRGQQLVIDRVKEAVEYSHRSTVWAKKLKETQLQMQMAELQPKQDCYKIELYLLHVAEIFNQQKFYPGCHQCTSPCFLPRRMDDSAGNVHHPETI